MRRPQVWSVRNWRNSASSSCFEHCLILSCLHSLIRSQDTHTEAAIQGAINAVAAGRTTITVAHRLSTIMNSDLIIVLEQGRVLEQGTHEELLAKEGLYFSMWNRQQKTLELQSHLSTLAEEDRQHMLRQKSGDLVLSSSPPATVAALPSDSSSASAAPSSSSSSSTTFASSKKKKGGAAATSDLHEPLLGQADAEDSSPPPQHGHGHGHGHGGGGGGGRVGGHGHGIN
jgi:hypothetical protein